MVDLKKLKSLTENLTVLYVEDSGTLLKRMSMFLNNIFKEVYEATNGQEGLSIYEKHKPDIVITDLNMPVMDGHTMILNLKKINPQVSIIIVSAYSDTDNLLKSIHLGVADFVPKPIDSKLLQGVLYKVARNFHAHMIVEEKEILEKTNDVDIVVDEMIMKRLEVIHKSHLQVEFLNHYKGVPIADKGKIISTSASSITVTVPFFQGLAIKFEGSTIIQSEILDKDIEADLERVAYDESLVLTNLHYIQHSFKRRKQLTIEPDNNFKVIIKSIGKLDIPLEVKYISSDFMIVKHDSTIPNFREGSEANLQITINILEESNRMKEEIFETKAEIFTIDNEGVTMLFQLQNKAKKLIEEYIAKRRLDLISEFKQIKKI